jgi:uncharacterized protein YhaN
VRDIKQLEENKAAVKQSLNRLTERLAVYRLTRNVIEEARGQTMRSASDALEPKIGEHLRRITSGRYTRVRVGDGLKLHVFSEEKQGWIDVDNGQLSSGTQDQLYLSARLALIELLFNKARPPLLLDDPFTRFDPARREQAVELCKDIGDTYQVLLFTCHHYYDSEADHIVRLPDPF